MDRLARRYRATCLRFADRTQETPYAEAFAALITSGGASQVDGRGFDIVLAMERQFQLELTRLLEECLREEEQCRRRYAKLHFRRLGGGIDECVHADARHNAELQIDPDTCAEELQLLQVTNESRISEIKSRQRVLFRERVLQLYALLSQGKTYDELDWLQQVLSFESVETVKEGKVIDNGAATSQTAEAISVEESSPPPASDPPAVTSIIEMGFSAEQARAALSLCDGNVVG